MWPFKKKISAARPNHSDKYTYFVTSEFHDKFEIEKMHGCTWLYKDQEECVELGFQIKLNPGVKVNMLKEEGSDYFLPLTFWGQWINPHDGNDVIDLYPAVSEMRNARFIFNDDCVSVRRCDSWSTDRGFEVEFASGKRFCSLPANPSVKDGRIDFKIAFPTSFDEAKSLYVRVCSRVPPSSLSFHGGETSKKIYAYNININQMRNAPNNPDFHVKERCVVRSLYVIHIFPSCYTLSFADKNFKGIRMLESERYNEYVKGVGVFKKRVEQDEQVVSFNKIEPAIVDQSTEYTYFSVFEKDIIGKKQWCFALGGAIVGAGIGFLLSFIPGFKDSALLSKIQTIEKQGLQVLQSIESLKCIKGNESATVN